ncbi:MAG: hypothetical protein V1655_03375 [bacterium]
MITQKEYERYLLAYPALSSFVQGFSLTADLDICNLSKREVRKFLSADKIHITFCDKERELVEVICADEESWSDAIKRVAGKRPMREIYHISKKRETGKRITIFLLPTMTATDANFQRRLARGIK